MVDYKVLAQPSAIQTGDTRDNVYYPQIVNLSTLNTRGLIQAMMNMGSTAFSMGEYLGVASDLGSAIAQMLITGHKINLEGLGIFTPKVETTQKNVKESSAVNSANFSCTVVFTPAEEFISILNSVVWNRVQSVDPGQSSSNAFTVSITSPSSNTLKFTPSKAGALQGFPATGEFIKIDGAAVDANNIRYDAASGNVYVYNVAGGKHNIQLSVGTSRGFEAYSHTWENVPVANAAAVYSAWFTNSDDEYEYLKMSVNGSPIVEGGDVKSITVEADQPVEVVLTSPGIPNGMAYQLEYIGYPDSGSDNIGIEVLGAGNTWSTVPENYTQFTSMNKDMTATMTFRFRRSGNINFRLVEV